MSFDFGRIASQYAKYRTVHPGVLEKLLNSGINSNSRVLEIGCGTGNYIISIESIIGCKCWGIDISKEMLEKAKEQNKGVNFLLGKGEELEFPGKFFDLVFSVNVIHHITKRAEYFKEAYRVLKNNGKICTATDSEWILRNRRPLTLYFPETLEVDLKRYPKIEELKEIMTTIGFKNINEDMVEYYYKLEDIQAYKNKVFSSLNLISEEAFQRGINRMEEDLKKGPIQCVSRFSLVWGERIE
ncbi:MAG: class I SAM-dependent methyltransferase [bacterium]